MPKNLSASGGLRPSDPLTRGSAPGPRWGLCPRPPYRLALRARHVPLTFKLLPPPLLRLIQFELVRLDWIRLSW